VPKKRLSSIAAAPRGSLKLPKDAIGRRRLKKVRKKEEPLFLPGRRKGGFVTSPWVRTRSCIPHEGKGEKAVRICRAVSFEKRRKGGRASARRTAPRGKGRTRLPRV